MFTALNKRGQEKAYLALRAFCDQKFSLLEETQDYRFYRDKAIPPAQQYGLSIYRGPKTFGISLDGFDYTSSDSTMRMVLKFATYSNDSGVGPTAALLASNSRGRIALFHSGRVYTADGRGSPGLTRSSIISGKKYFFVSYLDDVKLLSRLVAFHQSRKGVLPTVVSGKPKEKEAVDLGKSTGGVRGEVFFEARHHPVASALQARVESEGWTLSRLRTHCVIARR